MYSAWIVSVQHTLRAWGLHVKQAGPGTGPKAALWLSVTGTAEKQLFLSIWDPLCPNF